MHQLSISLMQMNGFPDLVGLITEFTEDLLPEKGVLLVLLPRILRIGPGAAEVSHGARSAERDVTVMFP